MPTNRAMKRELHCFDKLLGPFKPVKFNWGQCRLSAYPLITFPAVEFPCCLNPYLFIVYTLVTVHINRANCITTSIYLAANLSLKAQQTTIETQLCREFTGANILNVP